VRREVEDEVETFWNTLAHVGLDKLDVEPGEAPPIAAGPDQRDDVHAIGEQSPNEIGANESAGTRNQRA
jgi:hypothetical protein